MTIEEAFGAVIRRLRREFDFSQEKLAHESGLDRSFISNIESGKQQPSLITVFAIANSLNIVPSTLLKEVELLLSISQPDLFKSELSKWEFEWVGRIEKVIDSSSEGYKGSETVLIVEGDTTIRNTVASLFADFGYKTLCSGDGSDAVQKFRDNYIDLTVMDICINDKNGIEVYHEFMAINARAKIILTSGYRPTDIKCWEEKVGDKLVVFKPYSPLELLKVARTALSG